MKRFSILPLTLLAIGLVWGCSEEKNNGVTQPEPTPPPQTTEVTCLSCHSSESELKSELATAPTPVPALEMGPATSDG
jgi:hypothetical protein